MVRRFWSDPDRRRAGMLSVLVHALLLIALMLWIDLDLGDPEPQERFLVIDLGTPMLAEEAMPAPADDAPAPDAPAPAVEADAPGAPVPGTPDPDAVTAGEPEIPVEPEATDPAPEAPPPEEVDVPDPTPPEVATGPVDVPTPSVRTPEAPPPSPAPELTATVPEIESPELEPRPLADALPMPTPSTTPSGGAVAVADVTPEVQDEARALVPPPAQVEGPTATGLPAPTPTVDTAAAPRPVATPEAVADAPEGRELDAPAVRTEAAPARALGTEPTAAGVQAARSLTSPAVQAQIRTAAPADEAAAPGAAANVPFDPDAQAGGDAPRPGQPGDLPDAVADALGLSAGPDGDPDGGGAPQSTPPPPDRTLPRPLAVVVDNANQGYERLSGLTSASWIAEMPVEGGQTRLMPVFDVADPGRVGPVRSLRDYFVHLADRTDAVLVHDGGSPDAMLALRNTRPSLNAFQRGDLFSRAADGSPPYNLFSQGSALRGAIAGLEGVSSQRLVEGFRPMVPQDEDEDEIERADEVDIVWGGVYRSGFVYQAAQDRYRWIRNGQPGVQADGQAILVDAVLIARIEARPIPGDTEGRLFVPVDGGDEATLLWRGTVQTGRWSADGGLRFTTDDGTEVALEALRTWVAFVPKVQTVELR